MSSSSSSAGLRKQLEVDVKLPLPRIETRLPRCHSGIITLGTNLAESLRAISSDEGGKKTNCDGHRLSVVGGGGGGVGERG